ncbi:WW domain-containing oxidoreductase [Cytospora mali]|uniref:WW domain-containing oxidoreductase n=1 Tax=Cytospora mali TaxID=578113 RepID=A0A194VNS5_CYTMA|nr:WW domain-containing oxidoreductase [Valsa mali]
MANIAAKTVVATGASSGLGFELVKQLLAQAEPYRFILGARDTETTKKAYDELKFDSATHSVTVLPLELSNLKGVKSFSQQTLQKLGQDKLDYLLLNAGVAKGAEGPGPYGSKWCEPYIVNHLSQHYLTHLLREKLVASNSRVIVVSSGAVRLVTDAAEFDKTLLAGSGLGPIDIYSGTKFVQLLGAHWWRRQLPQCDVLAVSPGLIPQTGLSRHSAMSITASMPDAKSVPEGAQSILRAFTRSDFPSDPEQIFLTSWGEWWGKDVYEKTLDKELQEKWCPSQEDIEQTEGISQ